MATNRQKEAARRNIARARQAQSAQAHGANVPRRGEGMSTAEEDKLADKEFAFPNERKEPLTDARRVRNAIARFGQVEGVSDADRGPGTGPGSGSWTPPDAMTSKSPPPAGGTCPRAARTANASQPPPGTSRASH